MASPTTPGPKSGDFKASSSSHSSAPAPAHRQSSVKTTTDPILRNALRYTISAREYALLHKYLVSRSRVLKKRMPAVETIERIVDGPSRRRAGSTSLSKTGAQATEAAGDKKDKDVEGKGDGAVKDTSRQARPIRRSGSLSDLGAADYNARAIRHSMRVFIVTGTLMKLYETLSARLARRRSEPPATGKKMRLRDSPALRLSLSLSSILLLHRLLFRFFTRLRLHLLDPSAAPFRQRNPSTAGTLTSPYAPAVGASLAGLALGIYPSQQLRVSLAILAIFRALEFGWNRAEDSGAIWGWEAVGAAKGAVQRLRMKERPWWFGSWLLEPLALGQLFHAFVFDRETVPNAFGRLFLDRSATYFHPRPHGLPASSRWPGAYDVVDSLAQMARLNWPSFVSPTLFPNKEDILPVTLVAVAPLTSGAHPLITSLSCATLHPTDPSCTRTYLTFWLRSFGPTARLFLLFYSIFFVPQLRSLYHSPVSTLHSLFSRALGMTTFLTGITSTLWASICFFQTWFPRSFLPTQRFFLGGFLAGLWAWIERKQGRPIFLYSARMSVDSLWKVGVKRRWWRAMKGGDVWLFALALVITNVVYQRDAQAVREAGWRKGISWVRGEGWHDWAIEDEEVEGNDDEKTIIEKEAEL